MNDKRAKFPIAESMLIERAGNGWTVRPMPAPGCCVLADSVLVFQELGYASGYGGGHPETLLEFLQSHFRLGQEA